MIKLFRLSNRNFVKQNQRYGRPLDKIAPDSYLDGNIERED
jgi:hypothetical protein